MTAEETSQEGKTRKTMEPKGGRTPGQGLRVLIAGGGTGGHLFPGLAIATALARQEPDCEIRFAGTRHGIEERVVPAQGYRLHRLTVRGLVGISWPKRLWRMLLLPWAFLQCLGILISYRPQLVIGVGGYASGPVLATALLFKRLLRICCVLQEQNAYPGLTNRLLGRRVTHAFLAVEDQHGFFPRATVTGNPVRTEVTALREPNVENLQNLRDEPLVFVFGGSQGAHVLNLAMMSALPFLSAWDRPLRILHQTGTADLETVRAAYASIPASSLLEAEAVSFIDDMADAYRKSRLIVGRAGASAVSEIVVARRASLLVPIPGSSGNHQVRNANRMVDAKASIMMEEAHLSGDVLAANVLGLLANPARIDAMEAATDQLYKGDSAERIATRCLEMVGVLNDKSR